MTAEVEFYVPPKNQGQIVEVSYGCDEIYVYRLWHDRSDGEKRYARSRLLTDDDGCYWNHSPKNRRWIEMSKSEWAKYFPEEKL